jgi:hypothetical protein
MDGPAAAAAPIGICVTVSTTGSISGARGRATEVRVGSGGGKRPSRRDGTPRLDRLRTGTKWSWTLETPEDDASCDVTESDVGFYIVGATSGHFGEGANAGGKDAFVMGL